MRDTVSEEFTPRRAAQILLAFEGRIGRITFAMGLACIIALALALTYVAIALAGNNQGVVGGTISLIAALLALATLWPLFALTAKRLHDLGRSGWHILWLVALWLIPILVPDTLGTLAIVAGLAAWLGLAAMPGAGDDESMTR